MTIRAIWFDLDDTLLWDERSVEEAFAAACQFAQEKAGVDPVKFEESVRTAARDLYASYETYPFTQNIGINPFEALWAHFTGGEHKEFRMLQEIAPQYRAAAWTLGLEALDVKDEELGRACAQRFMEERRQRPYVYDETFEVLESLRQSYQLVLLTNGAPCLQQEKLDGVPGIQQYFDHIFISGNFDKGKPALSLYEYGMKLTGIPANEAIMVGDKLTTDIQGAVNAGMHNAWINRNDKPLTGPVQPEYTIKSLTELQEVINHINKQQTVE
ncbi:HAD family hydrolase [Paenibacillus marinisediminis]